MKSLIIFGSKYGTTETCAKKLKGYLQGEVDIVNVNKAKPFLLDNYDNIIIGSSVYAGSFNKDVKIFIENNKEKLINKNLGLFMCCMSNGEKIEEQFKQNISKDILERVKVKSSFGGEFKFSKMNFFEKNIVKIISKQDKNLSKVNGKSDISNINGEAIRSFAKIIEKLND